MSNGARAGSGRPPLAGEDDDDADDDDAELEPTVADELEDFEDEQAARTAAAADDVRKVRRERLDIARTVGPVTVP